MKLQKHRKYLFTLLTSILISIPAFTIHANMGWVQNEGKWYFYDNNGIKIQNARASINGTPYLFDKTGVMSTGWFLESSGRWFYFDHETGAGRTGWHKINGKDYYFDPNADGVLLTNTVTPDGYVVDKYGAYTGQRSSSPTPRPQTKEAHIQAILELVNSYRADHGLRPLSLSRELNAVSDIRSKEIVNIFSHSRPNGTLEQLYSQYQYHWIARGENIAMGQTTPEYVMTCWMNSEGHRNNILSKAFTEIGIGYHTANNHSYWVQSFGAR